MNGRVLITGAAGALGRSVVARFLEAGDRVLAVDADEEALAALTSLAPSDTLSVRRVDLADTAEVERLETTYDKHHLAELIQSGGVEGGPAFPPAQDETPGKQAQA